MNEWLEQLREEIYEEWDYNVARSDLQKWLEDNLPAIAEFYANCDDVARNNVALYAIWEDMGSDSLIAAVDLFEQEKWETEAYGEIS